MSWFPVGRDQGGEWRLDIVALLAVTGESFIHEHSQAISSSRLCMLPRIMPAPQALMRPWRPASLPSEPAKVTSVHSGINSDSVGFFANILHPLEEFQPFSFKVLRLSYFGELTTRFTSETQSISRKNLISTEIANLNGSQNPSNVEGVASSAEVESNGLKAIRRRATLQETISEAFSNAPRVRAFGPSPQLIMDSERRGAPNRALYSPLNIVATLSFLMTLGLIVAAALWQDGTAMVAIVLISLASSIIGTAASWTPITTARRRSGNSRTGDIIIRTREGAFLLILCTPEVARELYTGVEECEYRVSGKAYRGLMILGAVIIMPAVILFGNCTFNMQLLVTVVYMVLNVVYWALGLIPKKYFWDFSRYVLQDVTPVDSCNAHTTTSPDDPTEGVRSFTRTLWYAIRETKWTGWVIRSGAVPATADWQVWLREAHNAAKSGDRRWPAVARRNILLKEIIEEDTELPRQGETRFRGL